MGGPDLGGLAARDELFLGELADRLQHRKPGPPRRPVGDQQRLAHQGVEHIQCGQVVAAATDCARSGEVEPSGEYRTPCQQRLFGVVEQVMGPLHRMTQCLVALQPTPRPDQQPEPVIEPIP